MALEGGRAHVELLREIIDALASFENEDLQSAVRDRGIGCQITFIVERLERFAIDRIAAIAAANEGVGTVDARDVTLNGAEGDAEHDCELTAGYGSLRIGERCQDARLAIVEHGSSSLRGLVTNKPKYSGNCMSLQSNLCGVPRTRRLESRCTKLVQ